jgi:hypothetical protein
MAPPAELVVEVDVELWAQSAAGKMTIDTIGKTFSKEKARKHRNWRLERSAEAMEPGFSPYKTKIISLFTSKERK